MSLDDLLQGTALELLLIGTMSKLDHHLWHFLWTYRGEAELERLFGDKYGFFVNDDGHLEYKAGTEELLKKLEISFQELDDLCDDGKFELSRPPDFVRCAKECVENRKSCRRKSSDGAPVADEASVADDGVADDAKVESVDGAPGAEVGVADDGVADGTDDGVADDAKVAPVAEVAEEEDEVMESNFEVASDEVDDNEEDGTEEEEVHVTQNLDDVSAEDWEYALQCIERFPVDIPIPADDDDDASETGEMQADVESVARRMNKEVYERFGRTRILVQSSRIPSDGINAARLYVGERYANKKQKKDEDS
jgi:hypothetical protein